MDTKTNLPLNYTIKTDKNAIKLYINGFLHVSIKRSRLIGVQSWEMDGMYFVEYTINGGSVLSEYNKIGKWKKVLELLDSLELYD